jgi:NADPH:quinone reductase-like Zn-dependent oxidoreductase
MDPDRFSVADGAPSMKAVVTIGQGGPEMLEYRDVPIPSPGPGEILLQVLAAGVNATDINMRLGWYSSSVSAGTAEVAAGEEPFARADGGWRGTTPFPLIQGTDCCGRVAAVGPGGDAAIVGRRVLVRPCMRPPGPPSTDRLWMGSDFDGAFAQYVKAPAPEVFPVESDLDDAELGAIPCAYGTAENMLGRAGVRGGERLLVTGASGGVGSAVVQLATSRGALVTALTGRAKMDRVLALGASAVVDNDDVEALETGSADVVIDNVSGPAFGAVLRTLRRGGRYVTSGAIAGPLVMLDKRVLYLNDLALIGCTTWDEPVFPELVQRIERREFRPPIAGTFPLEKIAEAQSMLLQKRHVGGFVLLPRPPSG